jgi:hypothetical protein
VYYSVSLTGPLNFLHDPSIMLQLQCQQAVPPASGPGPVPAPASGPDPVRLSDTDPAGPGPVLELYAQGTKPMDQETIQELINYR